MDQVPADDRVGLGLERRRAQLALDQPLDRAVAVGFQRSGGEDLGVAQPRRASSPSRRSPSSGSPAAGAPRRRLGPPALALGGCRVRRPDDVGQQPALALLKPRRRKQLADVIEKRRGQREVALLVGAAVADQDALGRPRDGRVEQVALAVQGVLRSAPAADPRPGRARAGARRRGTAPVAPPAGTRLPEGRTRTRPGSGGRGSRAARRAPPGRHRRSGSPPRSAPRAARAARARQGAAPSCDSSSSAAISAVRARASSASAASSAGAAPRWGAAWSRRARRARTGSGVGAPRPARRARAGSSPGAHGPRRQWSGRLGPVRPRARRQFRVAAGPRGRADTRAGPRPEPGARSSSAQRAAPSRARPSGVWVKGISAAQANGTPYSAKTRATSGAAAASRTADDGDLRPRDPVSQEPEDPPRDQLDLGALAARLEQRHGAAGLDRLGLGFEQAALEVMQRRPRGRARSECRARATPGSRRRADAAPPRPGPARPGRRVPPHM